MGRADTHLAACAIAVALLLAIANSAIAAADTPDSAGSQNSNTTASDANQPSHTTESEASDESAKNGPTEAVQTNSVAATESDPKPDIDEAEQKKPVDKESCADNHHGKVISTPVPQAP